MIHNMILDYNRGYHYECSVWENFDWEVLDPNTPDDQIKSFYRRPENSGCRTR